MGICSSCLRGGDVSSRSNQENEQLLQDESGYGEGSLNYNNEPQYPQYARDLSDVIKTVQNNLIDIPAIDQNENDETPITAEGLGDKNALVELYNRNFQILSTRTQIPADQRIVHSNNEHAAE